MRASSFIYFSIRVEFTKRIELRDDATFIFISENTIDLKLIVNSARELN